jgi:hypothetical protein
MRPLGLIFLEPFPCGIRAVANIVSVECPSAGTAIVRAEVLSRIRSNVGAVAFSRTGDPDVGVFEDAVILKKFGDIPIDLSMLY